MKIPVYWLIYGIDCIAFGVALSGLENQMAWSSVMLYVGLAVSVLYFQASLARSA